MSTLFPTYPNSFFTPVKGEGCYLYDLNNIPYLDFTSGIGVNQLGHVPPIVKDRIEQQLARLWHTSNLFTITPAEELAKKLTEISGLNYVFFANSGAEANEAAIKLARRFYQVVKGLVKNEIITFKQSFHGRTLATLTATGQEKVKTGFSPLPKGFHTVSYNDLISLKEAITPQTAAIMLEVIIGEGGVIPAQKEWLKEVKKLTLEHDLLLIIDEVQTGIGRTGKWFGFQHYDIAPDIITVAKGLGNGFPIGAMLGSEKLKEAFSLGSHGSTFGGNFLATTAGLAVIETIEKEDLLAKVANKGNLLKELLQEKLGDFPSFVEVRGSGLMIGIEWQKPVAELLKIALKNRLLILSAGEKVIRLLPPLIISEAEIITGVEKLRESIEESNLK